MSTSRNSIVPLILILVAGFLGGSVLGQEVNEARNHLHTDRCVVDHGMVLDGLDASKGLPPLGNGFWDGNVFVLPFTYGGVYDREEAGAANVAARQWVTRSFLDENPDRFDFMLVFTNFPWDSGEARGLYWSIANDVEGIGVDVFDLSSEFGSDALQGYIDGTLLADYRLPDGSLDQERVKEIINHELGHRWLVNPSVDEGSGPTDALLGRDGSHWSYLYGVDDFMYGSQWTDNGDGTFTATSVRQRFSPLSLYLMGMTPPASVPPFRLLENPDIDVTQIPMLGTTIEATARTLSVDDVIRAEGARFPDDEDSMHEFRVGMIFLTNPDEPYSTLDVALLEDFRSFWQESFFRHTLGRGVVQLKEQGGLPPGGANVNLPLAMEWLARQGGGGLWADSATTELRDSAAAIGALGRAGGYFSEVEDAVRQLDNQVVGTAGLRYRKLEALALYGDDPGLIADLADEIEAEQNADGGWPTYPRYTADAVTTARAVRALVAVGRDAPAGVGMQWLWDQQGSDGGWGWQPGSPSSVPVTLEVLLAARAADELGFWTFPQVVTGVAWLLDRRLDGGFGDLYPNPMQTALFLQLVLDQTIDQGLIQDAIDFLAAHQSADGSWEASSYKTAAAVNALVGYLLPDPYVDQAEAFAEPNQPFDGEDVRLIAAIRNGGAALGLGTEYEWQIYRADDSLALVLSGILPALGETGFTTVDDLVVGGDLTPGDYTALLVIDPLRKVSQKTRSNDTAEVPLTVRTHPAGIDLALADGDMVLLPEVVTAVPMMVTVQGIVRNQGLTASGPANFVVFDGDPADNRRLGSGSVNVPALGQVPFSIDVLLTEARGHLLTVVADPDRLLEDADHFNNEAARQMVLRLEPDLEIRAGGVVVTPPAVAVGEPVRIDAEVWNGGTTTLGSFQVAFSYEFQASTFLIQQLTIEGPLAPGESTTIGVDWTPNVSGSIPVTVEADPQGVIGDLDPSDNVQTVVLAIGASPLPNLRVTAESFSFLADPPLHGQTAQITVALLNPSGNNAGAFNAELWLDAIDSGQLLANQSFAGLPAGGSVNLSSPWVVVDPEDRLVYVLVDRVDAVEELDESDNQAFVEVDVQTLPDLAVTGGGIDLAPSFPQVGDSLHIDVQVANLGDQPSPASLLEWVNGAALVLDSVAIPVLAGHTEVTLGLDWNPGSAQGEFELVVRVNADGSFPELDTANNMASFSVAIQSGDLFVSNQIFSPNGDAVRDTTRISFRNGAETVQIFGPRGGLTRTLGVEPGEEAVVWDGLDERGNLARDGLYQVHVGGLQSWVVLDNNLFAVTSELQQLLFAGFLSPQFPNPSGDVYSYFVDMVRNPVIEEFYLVERFHLAGTSGSEDDFVLQKWNGSDLIEIGEFPANSTLLASNLRGDTFLASNVGSDPYALVRFPEGTVIPLSEPGPYGLEPWLSPDSRWVVWASFYENRLFIEDLENPGDPLLEFPYVGPSVGSPCGYSIDWTHNQRANVVVGVTYGESYFFDISFVGTESGDPPTVEVKGTSNDSGCAGGIASVTTGGEEDKAAVGGSRYDRPDTATDFGAGQFVWVTASDGGYGYAQGGSDRSQKEGESNKSFRVVWADPAGAPAAIGETETHRWSVPVDLDESAKFQKGAYPGSEIDILVVGLEDGELLEQGSFESGSPLFQPPLTSISNDGFLVAFSTPDFGRGGIEFGNRQALVDWRSGEERDLPFFLEQPLWSTADKYLVAGLNTTGTFDGQLAYFTPTANLTTRLKPRVLFGDSGIDLWVLVTDRYMDYYQLEYADLNAAELVYEPIGLPSNELLFGESWGTWLPPGNGTYRVRLTARDRAGNERSVWRRVVWNGDRDIANLYTENRYMSPRASFGIKDLLTFHYTVLRAANLDFAITDEDGNIFRQIPVAADTVGPMTSTWDGDDEGGNPVPDGRYLLTYGEATWPVIVDNTPSEAVLRFSEIQLAVEDPPPGGVFDEDLLFQEIFVAVRDANVEEWEYQSFGTHADSLWATEFLGTEPLEADGDTAWRIVGAHQLVASERRIVARDLAGNETATTRGHLDERLLFTDSEPGCRTANPPCIYPERPELETISDSGGFLVGEDQILSPFYDTLLLQSTVQSDLADLGLEYREISLLGLPSGPWQSGELEVSQNTVLRSFFAEGVSSLIDGQSVPVTDTLTAMYWNHPGLRLVPHEVRLRATSDSGQEWWENPSFFSPRCRCWSSISVLMREGIFSG